MQSVSELKKIKQKDQVSEGHKQSAISCLQHICQSYLSPPTTTMLLISQPIVRALGLCFVDLIWFSLLIVDAVIYASAHSSRWRSKNLVLPLPSVPHPSHLQHDSLLRLPDSPTESPGSKSIPAKQISTKNLSFNNGMSEMCMYLRVYQALHWVVQIYPDHTRLYSKKSAVWYKVLFFSPELEKTGWEMVITVRGCWAIWMIASLFIKTVIHGVTMDKVI